MLLPGTDPVVFLCCEFLLLLLAHGNSVICWFPKLRVDRLAVNDRLDTSEGSAENSDFLFHFM